MQFRSPIYQFAVAHINWELIAVDLPLFFRKNTLKIGLGHTKSGFSRKDEKTRGTTLVVYNTSIICSNKQRLFNGARRFFLLHIIQKSSQE